MVYGEETGEGERAGETGRMKIAALLLGLWCLILGCSTGQSAAQIKLLVAHVHRHFKSLPYIFSSHHPEVNFSFKGLKACMKLISFDMTKSSTGHQLLTVV